MNLKNMKMSEDDREESSMPKEAEKPEYPYGLRLNLEKESLAKLGIKELPRVGDKMMLTAIVEVCSVSENESEYGSSKCCGLQITDMALNKESGAKAEDKLYNG